jgi:glycosyltransferase involved in cell wall biosynthesis
MASAKKAKESGSNGHHRIIAVIPAYNEERFIGSVVLKTRQYADAVIVVDDGSIDATGKIAEAAGAVVVQHPQNLGKGVALSTGFCRARELDPAVVVTLDADGQHSPEDVTCVAAPVLDGQADIVVGSRYLEKKSRVPLHRVWGHLVFNLLTNQVSGVPVTDSQSGFRAFSPLALCALSSLHSNGFSVESEMQLQARDHSLRVTEVPIKIHYYDKPKRPVVIHGLMVLNGILRLMGQQHPLLFFGLPGTVILLAGLLWGTWVVGIYGRTQVLALGYALLSMLLFIVGSLGIFAGITLHSTRELILELVRSKDVM